MSLEQIINFNTNETYNILPNNLHLAKKSIKIDVRDIKEHFKNVDDDYLNQNINHIRKIIFSRVERKLEVFGYKTKNDYIFNENEDVTLDEEEGMIYLDFYDISALKSLDGIDYEIKSLRK